MSLSVIHAADRTDPVVCVDGQLASRLSAHRVPIESAESAESAKSAESAELADMYIADMYSVGLLG